MFYLSPSEESMEYIKHAYSFELKNKKKDFNLRQPFLLKNVVLSR